MGQNLIFLTWFLEMVTEVWFSKAANSPSGSAETELFSILNSSSIVHLAKDLGIDPAVKRLYLK